MIHALQYLAGFLAAYFVMSPRLRKYTISVIAGYIVWFVPSLRAKVERAAPVELLRKRKVETSGGKLLVDEDTAAEWMKNLERNGG